MSNPTNTKHTPLPWGVSLSKRGVKGYKKTSDNVAVTIAACNVSTAIDKETQEANASYIVKAVNNHEALRDALETLMIYADNCESHPEYLQLLKASE
jgi:hypothetical protein